MGKSTKFHLYQIYLTGECGDLKKRLKKIDGKPLKDRFILIDKKSYRAEKIKFDTYKGKDVAFLNFVHSRDDGPGKTSENVETQGVGLKEGEKFAEEAAIMIDFVNLKIIGEYNHYGAKVSTFMRYLSNHNFDLKNKSLTATAESVLLDDAETRLRSKKGLELKSYEIKLAPEMIDINEPRAEGVTALDFIDRIVDDAKNAEGDMVTLRISARKGQQLNTGAGKKIITKVLDLLKTDKSENRDSDTRRVRALRVTAKGDQDDKPELLDFLNARMYNEVSIMVRAKDRRRPYSLRKSALKSSYNLWFDQINYVSPLNE